MSAMDIDGDLLMVSGDIAILNIKGSDYYQQNSQK